MATVASSISRLRLKGQQRLALWRRNWIILFGFGFVAWFMGLLVADVRIGLRDSPFSGMIAGNILVWTPLVDHLVMLLVMWGLAVGVKSPDLRLSLPLSTREFRKGFWKNPFVLLLGAILVGLLISGASYLINLILGTPESAFWKKLLSCHTCTWAYVVETVAIAPLVEEIVFRGLLFGPVERAAGKVWAVILTALAFLGIHLIQAQWELGIILSVLLFGLAAGLLRAKTGSVWPGWIAHMAANLVAGIFLLERL